MTTSDFNKYFLTDFVEIQRKSFFRLLEKGIIEEFSKRNPIQNTRKTMELFFYPEYYQLTSPEYTPSQAIIKSKSYISKLYIPVQLTDKTAKTIKLKWVYIGDIPLMTKRGHFILNGCARVIVNQMIRSPGIYYHKKLYENFSTIWNEKPDSTFVRYYADLICNRGTWLRIEIDKKNKIWAQMKRVPKIPIMWFLIAVGLTERIVLKSIIDSQMLFYNFLNDPSEDSNSKKKKKLLPYVTTPPAAWAKIYNLVFSKKKKTSSDDEKVRSKKKPVFDKFSAPNTETNFAKLINKEKILKAEALGLQSERGRKWIFNKFMNPRTYDLGKVGRLNFNQKLKVSVSPTITTLTPQDLLAATNYLILVSKELRPLDDIDHLKNRRVRTSGELIQIQVGVGLLRLEKSIKEKMNYYTQIMSMANSPKGNKLSTKTQAPYERSSEKGTTFKTNYSFQIKKASFDNFASLKTIGHIMNTKPFNGALREFFGTNPLSQFMDQINPLAELTHKRRLSSMGPGGVSRDSATLAIRGIHPSHYGRICPVETPEGKNTGLVNSLTAYARVNSEGLIETPFYRVYKGQVQKKTGLYFFSAKHEEKIRLGAADLYASSISFLPQASIPVRIVEDFTKIARNSIQYVGVAPIQMISIATSLIPFFEHDDANRALMGSNMQRQAVPILKPQRPIVGTGLEPRAVSDSGHVITAQYCGIVTYASANKITIFFAPGLS